MNAFCTYFDTGYASRGLALLDSLWLHCQYSRVWVLCLDESVAEQLKLLVPPRNHQLHLLTLAEIETQYPELLEAKQTRSRVEYIFTLSPVVPLHILDLEDAPSSITYLDADLLFFASPDLAFAELEGASVGITPHRFPIGQEEKSVFGVFNVGFNFFRNDAVSREVLQDWRQRCLSWCLDLLECDKFADQKYLDTWPARWPNSVRIIHHPGINSAPWNLLRHPLRRAIDGTWWVGEQSLICFHFHGFKQVKAGLYDLNTHNYGKHPDALLIELYSDYVRLLNAHGGIPIGYARQANWSPSTFLEKLRFWRYILNGRYPRLPKK